MKRKICVVTGSRAEFGLMRWLMQKIRASDDLSLQVAVTGMHLSPEFGHTAREIEDAGFLIDEAVEMVLSSESKQAISKSMGIGLIGLSDALDRLSPDLLVLIGDRFEILTAAIAAMNAGIPVAHLHGGELTEGAIDDTIRHSITKMSHLHFVAAEEYKTRVIQLGEDPKTVFNVGGLGIDAAQHVELLPEADLVRELDLRPKHKRLVITFHPVTIKEQAVSEEQLSTLLRVLLNYPEVDLVFTYPNADFGGRKLRVLIDQFVSSNSNARAVSSLGQVKYFTLLSISNGVIGNSSSGLLEAPYFGIGTVNIGERQRGRLSASSVINCGATFKDLSNSIDKLFSADFETELKSLENPYQNGNASNEIIKIISSYPLENILEKKFHDIDISQG